LNLICRPRGRGIFRGAHEKYCWLDDEKAIFDLQYYVTLKLDQVRLDMASHFIIITVDDKKKPVTAVQAWLSSPDRLSYAGRRFKPGQPAFVDQDGETYINLWRGWGCEPVKGNVEPFTKLIERLCAGTEDEMTYLIRRLAFKIQKPWVKVPSFVLIVTDAEGSGKSQLVKFITGLYGQHGKIITDREMESSFDDWRAKGVLCVGCEEVSFKEKRSLANRLKAIASMEVDHINPKGQPSYQIENYFDLLFTANNHDAIYVRNERERRPFIVMHENVVKMSKEERNELQNWYDNGGKEALLHYLMHEVDCSDFDPYEDAPLTVGKREMAEAGRTTAEQFVADLLQDASEDEAAGRLRCQLKSFTDVLREYCGERPPDKRDEASLSKALRAAGPKSRRMQINGTRHRLYPVANLKDWAQKKEAEWVKEYANEATLRDAEEKKKKDDEQAKQYYERR
jgi:putative DNA primase/helicase